MYYFIFWSLFETHCRRCSTPQETIINSVVHALIIWRWWREGGVDDGGVSEGEGAVGSQERESGRDYRTCG